MASKTITLAFAGEGAIDQKAVEDHLGDWLGFEPDEEDILTSDIDVEVLLPASAESWTPSLQTVLKWLDAADVPYTVITDDASNKTYKKLIRNAHDVEETKNVAAELISGLEKVKGEKYLVLLWGENGDDFSDTLLDLATAAQIPIKDLTAGLDDLVLAEEDDPEIEEEPPMPRTPKKASEEPLEEPEIPLEEEEETPATGTSPEVLSVLEKVYDYLKAQDAVEAARNLGVPSASPLSLLVSKTLGDLRGQGTVTTFPTPASAPQEPTEAPETPEEPAPAAEEAPVRRGRGRPRKDGLPSKPREEATTAYILDGEGNYRKRGRGRLKRGEEVVQLTAEQVAELGLDEEE